MSRTICDEKCWTPVPCATCGQPLPPAGRKVPAEFNTPACCDENRHRPSNPRHLWDEHDDARAHMDVIGWTMHQALCDRCGPDDETET